MRLIDLTGQKFGRLTVLRVSKREQHDTYWLCKCDCGNIKEVRSRDLRNNVTKSCGCLHKECITKHKKCGHRLYTIWQGMKNRCYNTRAEPYQNYGDRGIIVCDEWKSDFMTFYNWAINNGYRDNLTIDRVDNNKNYSPDNCRWTNSKMQNRNTRHIRNITINNETQCLSELCEILNIKRGTVYARLQHNWDIELRKGK